MTPPNEHPETFADVLAEMRSAASPMMIASKWADRIERSLAGVMAVYQLRSADFGDAGWYDVSAEAYRLQTGKGREGRILYTTPPPLPQPKPKPTGAVELPVSESDIDQMRDVYMTQSQRSAYDRILAAALDSQILGAALASRPAVGGDGATAFEGWTAAVHAASELEANAPDERYRNRAKAVRRWIEARRPRPTINELRRLTGGRSDADSQA